MQDVKCEGKTKYSTRAKAASKAKYINRRDDRAKLGPYRCRICSRWHIGNNTRKEKKWMN